MIFATFASSGSIPRCLDNARLQAGRAPAAARRRCPAGAERDATQRTRPAELPDPPLPPPDPRSPPPTARPR